MCERGCKQWSITNYITVSIKQQIISQLGKHSYRKNKDLITNFEILAADQILQKINLGWKMKTMVFESTLKNSSDVLILVIDFRSLAHLDYSEGKNLMAFDQINERYQNQYSQYLESCTILIFSLKCKSVPTGVLDNVKMTYSFLKLFLYFG